MAKASSKKKGTPKKKTTATKKPAKAKAPAKGKAKAPAKGKATAKAKSAKPAAPKKGAGGRKPTPSRSALLLKRFDEWSPASPYRPPDQAAEVPSAPPFVSGKTAKETDRLRSLLFKTFDLSERSAPVEPKSAGKPPAKAKAKSTKPAPRREVSRAELLKRRFGDWSPAELFRPMAQAAGEIPPSPPFVSGETAEETERLRSLLFRTFDLSDVTPAPTGTAEPEPPAPPAEKAPPPPRREIPRSELLRLRFDDWRPDELFRPAAVSPEVPAAPPFVSGGTADETERLRSLLFRTFELSDVTPVPADASVEAETAAMPEPEAPSVEPEPETTADSELPAAEADAATEPPPEQAETSPEVETAAIPEPESPPDEPPPSGGIRPTLPPMARMVAESADRAAPEQPSTQVPPIDTKGSDPMESTVKFFTGCLVLMFAFIIWASFSNASKYYVEPVKDGIEIWKGNFAPMGSDRLIRLPGAGGPDRIKDVYTAEEVLPLAAEYYLGKAEAALNVPGMPDYDKVRDYLQEAIRYGTRKEIRQAMAWMKDLRIIIFMNKADIAAARGTEAGIQDAIGLMEQAAALDSNDILELNRESQMPLIEKKINALKDLLTAPDEAVEAAPAG